MKRVVVRDAASVVVLSGDFSTILHGDGDPVHTERIVLDDPGTGSVFGVAGVSIDDRGRQELTTRATGLVPGGTYSVVIDGLPVAIKTNQQVQYFFSGFIIQISGRFVR